MGAARTLTVRKIGSANVVIDCSAKRRCTDGNSNTRVHNGFVTDQYRWGEAEVLTPILLAGFVTSMIASDA